MTVARFGKRGLDRKAAKAIRVEGEKANPVETKALRDQRLLKISYSLLGIAGLLVVITVMLPSADSGNSAAEAQPLPTREGWTAVSTDQINVSRPSEPQATYTVIGVAKTADGKAVSMNTRYSQQSGWNYTMRAFDCENGKIFTLGSGVTFEQMQVPRPDPQWSQLVQGSSATQVATIACNKIGKTLRGVQ